jgi:hypothetical protein
MWSPVHAVSLLDTKAKTAQRTETKTTTGLLGNGELVTGNHLNLNTQSHGIVDSLLGVVTGRVEDGEQANELEAIALGLFVTGRNFLESNSESAETTGSEFLDVLLELVLDLGRLVTGAELARSWCVSCMTSRDMKNTSVPR